MEEALSTIFAEVLKLERIGVRDNFFELGGHSLSATQIVSRVREAFRMELPVRKIFEEPTVEGLAQALLEDYGERIEHTAELLLQVSSFSDEETARLTASWPIRLRSVKTRTRSVADREPPPKSWFRPSPPPLTELRRCFCAAASVVSRSVRTRQYLYNLPAAIRLHGALDVTALERSLNKIRSGTRLCAPLLRWLTTVRFKSSTRREISD